MEPRKRFKIQVPKEFMEFTVDTSGRTDVVDITDEIESRIEIEEGVCEVFVPHTTAGVAMNENEPRLLEDIKEFLESFAVNDWRHDEIDDNASSHLVQLLVGGSETVPVENGKLALGTWQSVFLVELDGPRTRTVRLKTTG